MRGLRRGLEPLALARLLAARWTEAAAYAASFAAVLLFARFSIERHRSFESNAFDFGFFDQIIWNTAHGRFFQTTFVPYNFLGQHFEPVLLLFALAYRFGAGPETLLAVQSTLVAAAAIPLYYAVRRTTSSGVAGLTLAMAFLVSAPLHIALDFDFHPELMGFFFVFLAGYYVVAERPRAAILALLPLLLLKEDMPLVLVAFALVLYARGYRRHGMTLFGIAAVFSAAVVLIAMPLIRGGPSDLTQRYGYLVRESTVWSVAPHIVTRLAEHLSDGVARGFVRFESTLGFAAILSPLALVAAAPSILLAGLSEHPQQSRFDLHYVMAPLALSWVAAVIGMGDVARGRGVARLARLGERARPIAALTVGAVVLVASIGTFAHASAYSPLIDHSAPSAAHQRVIREALAMVPDDASVSAQGTLVPHLSHRAKVYEFPYLVGVEYAVVDPSLPISGQARAAHYDGVLAGMTSRGYDEIFSRDGVRVFRRSR